MNNKNKRIRPEVSSIDSDMAEYPCICRICYTYRLLGNLYFRALAFAIGSNDFTTSSGTVVAKDVADSSSLRGSEELPEEA